MSFIKGNVFTPKMNSTLSEKDNNYENIGKKPSMLGIIKKSRKKKEMDMISKNIRQSRQTLNNPEVFYTGLFNNIIEKHKKISNSITNTNIKFGNRKQTNKNKK